MEVVLVIYFLALNNSNVMFGMKKLTQKFYTTIKVLSTTSRVELIDKKDLIKNLLDKSLEIFIMYILAVKIINIYLF